MEATEGGVRVDERNGEDRFVRRKAGGFEGANMQRNLILFTSPLPVQRDRGVKRGCSVWVHMELF